MPGVSGLARGVASVAPYTPRAREGPGRECSSREEVSEALNCKISYKEASLLFGCLPDEAGAVLLFLPVFPQHFPLCGSLFPSIQILTISWIKFICFLGPSSQKPPALDSGHTVPFVQL